MVFRYVNTTTPEDVSVASTVGGGTAPNGPAITPASSTYGVFVSAVGLALSSSNLTDVSSYNNTTISISCDTHSATIGMAWDDLLSTAAYTPAAWTSSLSGAWWAASILLRSVAYTPTQMTLLTEPSDLRTVKITGY
jgi:hypothetical protein